MAQIARSTPGNRPARVLLDHGTAAETPRPVSIVAADSHPITLAGVGRLFEREGFDVRARCHDGDECLRALQAHQPDIVVLELHLPGKDGLTILREMKRQAWPTRAVVFTAAHEESQALEAMRLGARAVVLKEMDTRLLVECIRKVHLGEPWVDRRPAPTPHLDKLPRPQITAKPQARDLTGRELEIVRLVASGLRNRGVAERLGVTEGTVKVHLHNVYEKLGVKGRLALILFARSKGLA
jgi:DNA-binding NarL/FixJ family response regulator